MPRTTSIDCLEFLHCNNSDNAPDNNCVRCGGSGYIPKFHHVSNGVCFLCRGDGKYRDCHNIQNRSSSRRFPKRWCIIVDMSSLIIDKFTFEIDTDPSYRIDKILEAKSLSQSDIRVILGDINEKFVDLKTKMKLKN